jgi:hypothetical protein
MFESFPSPPSWSLAQWLGVFAGTGALTLGGALGYRSSQRWLDRQSPQRRRLYSVGGLATASVAAHVALLSCLPQPPRFPGANGNHVGADGQSMVAWLDTAATREDATANEPSATDALDPGPSAAPENVSQSPALSLPSLARSPAAGTDREPAEEPALPEVPTVRPEAMAPPPTSRPPSPLADASQALVDQQLKALLSTAQLPQPSSVISAPANQAAATADAHSPLAATDPAAMTAGVAADGQTVPAEFQGRFGAAKQQALAAGGGDENTEAAVAAALSYLARHQARDGAWDPLLTGAGRETYALGQDRQGAGRTATTGITGLALLAFIGAGHTQLQGSYTDTVGRGLAALISRQAADGSLAGPASASEAMYCHGIATLAICEAYALTRDPRLKPAAEAALAYTLRAQHPVTGGWRYRPGDQGDTSQLGWQALALHSGRLADLPVTPAAWRGIHAFLNSVSRGPARGLACYRPIDGPSRTMTAEALAVRLLLEAPPTPTAIAEAERYLREELPGTTAIDNYYYWYYAALALHGCQSPLWPEWNQAMQKRLLSTQLRTGDPHDGSWPVSELWGGYGGTVYTTSMGALCLEVYYRHLPIYQPAAQLARQPDSTLR